MSAYLCNLPLAYHIFFKRRLWSIFNLSLACLFAIQLAIWQKLSKNPILTSAVGFLKIKIWKAWMTVKDQINMMYEVWALIFSCPDSSNTYRSLMQICDFRAPSDIWPDFSLPAHLIEKLVFEEKSQGKFTFKITMFFLVCAN